MQVAILTQQLFHQPSLKTVSVATIEQFNSQYPFFAAGHYLLLKKMQEENHPDYSNQLQKTGSYFYNELWLQWLVQQPTETEQMVEQPVTELPDTPIVPAPQPITTPVDTVEIFKADTTEILVENTLQEAQPASVQTEDLISFEPYHTIDYFASQGIKVSKELVATDKLGRQLKSFTDWLKTMKRLPNAILNETLEEGMNAEVEAMAAHSLLDKHIVTETMAEVLAKQGQIQKAVEMYHKLSLLEPSKSPYFAAKIDSLKQY